MITRIEQMMRWPVGHPNITYVDANRCNVGSIVSLPCQQHDLVLLLLLARRDAGRRSGPKRHCVSYIVDTYGAFNTAEDIQSYVTSAYNILQIRSEVEDPKKYKVLLFSKHDGERPCSYVMLYDGSIRTGDDGPASDYVEVKRLYIDKPFHGQGAARVLMDHIMEKVREATFYQKYGFVETGEHVFMVGTVQDRDLLYTLQKE